MGAEVDLQLLSGKNHDDNWNMQKIPFQVWWDKILPTCAASKNINKSGQRDKTTLLKHRSQLISSRLFNFLESCCAHLTHFCYFYRHRNRSYTSARISFFFQNSRCGFRWCFQVCHMFFWKGLVMKQALNPVGCSQMWCMWGMKEWQNMLERGKQKNVGKTFDYSGHFKRCLSWFWKVSCT